MDYLSSMRLFVRALELGSFSKAAREGGVKTSTVSRAVTILEADLGVALLNRSTRRMHPTEAGRDFYDRAARILNELEVARSQVSLLEGQPQGLLRINIPGAFGRRHVIPLLPEFLARYPEITVDAVLTDTTVDIIEAGADLAIRIGALPDSSLIAKKLAPHERVLCASPGYLSDRPPIGHPQDLRGHACLPFSHLKPIDRWTFTRLGEAIDIPIRGPLQANDSDALRVAALSGLGIVLLPMWLVGIDLRAGRLLPLLRDWEIRLPAGDRAIWGVYVPKKAISRKVRVFLDFLEERYADPAYWDRPGPVRE